MNKKIELNEHPFRAASLYKLNLKNSKKHNYAYCAPRMMLCEIVCLFSTRCICCYLFNSSVLLVVVVVVVVAAAVCCCYYYFRLLYSFINFVRLHCSLQWIPNRWNLTWGGIRSDILLIFRIKKHFFSYFFFFYSFCCSCLFWCLFFYSCFLRFMYSICMYAAVAADRIR